MSDANPVGRPTLYDPRFCSIASRFAKLGLTIDEIAEALDIGRSTLYEWRERHPEFADAINEGRDIADAKVAASLFESACGYSHPAVKIMLVGGQVEAVPYIEQYPPNPTSCIFWLKNRKPALWRDQVLPPAGEPDDLAQRLQDSARAAEADVTEDAAAVQAAV